ncbi:uncharacterized protein VTP21DRAFT_10753 [Calcarisporiella thermophila]|uniref:uncharacterized protein n=1 Tax=Calcarisporiella thermophila TaxID=911321 RepID=UPI0037420AEA
MLVHLVYPLYAVALLSSAIYLFHLFSRRAPPITNARILIVTAHPDDECMFFGPAITALARGNKIWGLCLSSGNHDGLGEIRKRELARSFREMGVTEDRVTVIDHKELQDNPKRLWSEKLVSEVVGEYVKRYDIDTILTFDDGGVSGHPNHRACYRGVRDFVRNHTAPSAYALTTVSLARKYTALFDLSLSSFLLSQSDLFLISSPADFLASQRAMRCHRSQLVWFRHLYVLFSRYMWMNDFQRIDSNPL